MFDTHIIDYLNYLSTEKRYSPHTLVSYQNDLSQFTIFIFPEKERFPITEINYQHIRRWVADLLEHKIQPRSVTRKLSTLKSFFKYLQIQQVISVNPMAKITAPKTPKRLPVFITEDQLDNLFTEIEFEEGFNGLRDKLII